ncbi:MAG: PEP-CTERM sorting domain-containing protein [Burkholderiales bacterium]|nr:PEP-CTERM sorting domain-containing protein [Burkholderiales bacterium]
MAGQGGRLAAVAALAAWALASASAQAAPLTLAPQHSLAAATAEGAAASFFQVDSAWQGSTVLWNEATQSYGSGVAIGSYSWGTGLWGRADWQATQDAALGGNGPPVIDSWSGWASTINFGNNPFNSVYGASLGPATVVPMFDANSPNEDNWTSRFSGVFRVTEAGLYNFGVLNDDGFFLRLMGAGGQSHEIGRDYLNDPARSTFGDGLLLSEGLYGFELGEWNRLGVGVVDLRWNRGGTTPWELLPTLHLVPTVGTGQPVDEPASLLLAGAALALLARKRRRPADA